MATEYVDGVTLRQYLTSRRLKLVDVLDVTIQIVAALNAAHDAGVRHRDLKPENVMVRKDHIVKVLDFGLAKLAGGALSGSDEEAETRLRVETAPGIVMGTVSYMSPEQSAGKVVDQRTDIWSLGVVLYEMISATLPFEGKDVHRQIIAIQEQEPVPLSQLVEGVPERLEEIVSKCLAKEQDERYQTAKDLLIDLRNLRRKLDVDAEIERTVAPGIRNTSGGPQQGGKQKSQPGALTVEGSQAQPTTSAEYVVSGIKQHKLLSGIVLLLIIAVGIGAALYLRSPNTGNAIESIAVIPFENRSNAADTDYLSEGLAESLIYRLSQIPNLKVSPTSSVMRYKGKGSDLKTIANELGVRSVMTGRMAQRGDNLTISVELVDTLNNKLLWGEQYERKMSDLVATQREIAASIAQKLQLKLSGEDSKGLTKGYTTNSEAYQHYLQGRFYWNRRTGDNIKKAIEQFNAAVSKDPRFALAYAGLADCYVVSSTYTGVRSSETLPLAKENALKAIELDSSIAEPHAALGYINHFEWNPVAAEREYKIAIELNPNYPTVHHWYSRFLRSVNRPDEAWKEIKRAEELDPLSLVIINNVAEQYIERGELKSAVNECHRILSLDPNFWAAHLTLALVLEKQGQLAEALVETQKSLDLSNRSNASLALLGKLKGQNGKRSEALAIIKELEDRYAKQLADGRDVAVAYVGLNDKDQAFAWLEKSFQYHSFFLQNLRMEPSFDPLHDDPRWNDLLRRVGPI